MTYRPPVRDMAYLLNEVAGLKHLLGAGPFADVSADLVEAVMEEGAKLAADVLAPLNRSGDAEGAKLKNDGVSVPSGRQRWKSVSGIRVSFGVFFCSDYR